jgi:hypothetical protein
MLTKSDQLLGKFENLINGRRIYESRKVRLVGAEETTTMWSSRTQRAVRIASSRSSMPSPTRKFSYA